MWPRKVGLRWKFKRNYLLERWQACGHQGGAVRGCDLEESKAELGFFPEELSRELIETYDAVPLCFTFI